MTVLTLPYDQARSLIIDGDIVFIKDSPSWVGSVIRFFTKSRYSHVGIAFWITTGGITRLMMVEAQGGSRRRIVNLSKYAGVELDIMKAPKPWPDVAPRALEHLSDVPYGYMEAAYIGIVEAMQQYFDVTLPRKNFNGEICSEFVARVLELPSQHVSPQALMDQLVEMGVKPGLLVRG